MAIKKLRVMLILESGMEIPAFEANPFNFLNKGLKRGEIKR